MTAKTRLEIALVVISAAGFGFAWREARATRSTTGALEIAARRQAGLAERTRRAGERKATAEREQAELQPALERLRSSPPKPGAAKSWVELIPPAVAAAQLEVHKKPWRDIVLQNDPKLQALYLQSEPAGVALRYGAFLQGRGLSADQTEKFKGLLVEDAERLLDLKMTARTMNLSETDPAIVGLRQEAADQLHAAQAGLLGEAGYQQLQQYERALPVRDFVGTLAGSLAFTATPLSARQAEQLVQIMATADPGYQNGGKANPPLLGDMFDSLMMAGKTAPVIDAEAVLKPARSVLSEPQYAQFEARISGNQNLVQLFNLMVKVPGEPMVGFVFGRR